MAPDFDSLDVAELVIAFEEAFPDRSPEEVERLAERILERIKNGEPWDDLDDDLAVFVRKAGPKSPKGASGIAVKPDDDSEDDT